MAEADVWMGSSASVALTVQEDLSLLLPVLNQDEVEAQVVYDGPLEAPISAGDEVAELIITVDGLPDTVVPLIAASDVAEGGFETRLRVAAQVLLDKIGAWGAEDNPA